MTQNELKELIELVAEKGFAEFEVERSGFRLKIVAHRGLGAQPEEVVAQRAPVSAPQPATYTAPLPAAPPEPVATPEPPVLVETTRGEERLQLIKSPIVGTFYRSPKPESPPFVKIGDAVEVGSVLCIVEAMKLMNEIESEFSGEIVKIFVENGQPVEYGQPLFGIRQ